MGRTLKLLGYSLVSLVALSVGSGITYEWWASQQFYASTHNAYVSADITVVRPRVDGHIREILVVDHQSVAAGTVLARLEDTEARARVERAAAAIEVKLAMHGTLRQRISLQHVLVQEADAATESSEAGLDQARRVLARALDLADRGWESQQSLDTKEGDVLAATAALRRARAAASATREQVKVLGSEVLTLEAEIERTRADFKLAETALEATTIRAPVAGVVGNRRFGVGEFVKAGNHFLAVVPLDHVWIVANFRETKLGRIRPGQSVTVAIDSYPDIQLYGSVDSRSPASGAEFSLLPPENATGNFTKVVQRIPVRIALAAGNPLHGELVPGMSATVTVDTRTGEESRYPTFGLFPPSSVASVLH